MFFLPLKIETPIAKWPIVNIALLVFTTMFYFLVAFNNIPQDIVESMVLRNWAIEGLLGSLFLHGGFMHLLGNMIFLWVFGNAICGLIGNGFYLPVYLFLGLCGGAMHLAFSNVPALGASGAVNGIVGMTLYFFPRNQVKMFLWLFYRGKTFNVKSYWVILFWFLLDIFGLVMGGDGVAHWAHLGGFIAGIALAVVLDFTDSITTYDITLRDIFTGNTAKVDISDGKLTASDDDPEKRESTLGTAMLGAGDSMLEELKLQEKVQETTNQFWHQQQQQWHQSQPSSISVSENTEPRESTTTMPILRVLRAIAKDDTLTCYFVNEGDTVHDVHVMAGGRIMGDINPKEKLATKDAGAVRFTSCVPNTDFKFQVHFTENGEKLYKEFVYSSMDKKFYPVHPLG